MCLLMQWISQNKKEIKNMSLSGVNKLCAQCVHECKQWKQVKVVRCPFFKSKQQKSVKPKEGDTLQAQQNA